MAMQQHSAVSYLQFSQTCLADGRARRTSSSTTLALFRHEDSSVAEDIYPSISGGMKRAGRHGRTGTGLANRRCIQLHQS